MPSHFFPLRARSAGFAACLPSVILLAVAMAALGGCCQENSQCDDGLFCNGAELCIDFLCQAGEPPDCSDSVDCTEDSCNEVLKSCVSVPDDESCSDGLFCSGVEYCDALLDCMPGEPPSCSDSFDCTHDSCSEEANECTHEPDDALCADGEWCNGDEICSTSSGCLPGETRDCTDAIVCTVDECDEDSDACLNTPDDGLCADTDFCTQNERCTPSLGGCISDPILCDDGIDCTADVCDSLLGACAFEPDDSACADGNECTQDICDVLNGCRNPPEPDGTPCAPHDGTTVCVDGTCVERRCGDGYTEPLDSDLGPEECDDGNEDDTDGCTTLCRSLDFQVNTTEEGAEQNPAVSVFEDGGFVVVFEDETYASPSYTDVRFRRYNRRGNPLAAEDRLLCESAAGIQVDPDVAALPDGGFAAVYAESSSGGGDLFDVKLRIIDSTVIPFRTVTVNTATFGVQTAPRVEFFAGTGNLLVAWEDQTTLAGKVKFRRYDIAGVAIDTEEGELSSADLAHESQPAAAQAPDGKFLAVWTGSEDGSSTQVFARLFDSSAAPLGLHFPVSSGPCTQNYSPRVAWTEGTGNFVIVWERLCPGNFFAEIAATLVSTDDLSTIPEPLPLAPAMEESFTPVVATAHLLAVPTGVDPLPAPQEEHIILFLWAATSQSSDVADGPYDILGQRYTADDLGLLAFDAGPSTMTTIARFEQNDPWTEINSGGDLVLTWTDYSQSGSDASYSSVRARQFPNGWFAGGEE